MITLKVDTTKVQAKLSKGKKDAETIILKELDRFGQLTVSDAKRNCPVDEGFLRNSISYEPPSPNNLRTTVVVAANYAAYVEFGTRGFAASYVSSLPTTWQQYAAQFKGKGGGGDFMVRLMGWMKRKGINVKLAYVIARKILRFGVRAQPFLFPAVTKNFIELKNRLKQE